MTKVAVITRSISFGDGVGGLERAAADQVRALSSMGIDFEIFSPAALLPGAPSNVRVTQVPWPKLAVSRGPLFSLAYWWWTKRARRVLAASDADVLHFHGASVAALPRTMGDRAVTNPHGMEEFSRASMVRWLARAPLRQMGRHARRAAVVVSTDSRLTPAVITNLGVDASRVRLVPNAVDVASLHTLASKGQGLRDDRFIFMSLGRIVPNKGYHLLAEALSTVPRPFGERSWVWHHFGRGPDAGRLRSFFDGDTLVIHEGASDPDVHAALASADCFVQPSVYEGSSLTVLEAMAHGINVVATPVGGIPDKIVHLENGYLCEAPTAEALKAGLVSVLEREPSWGAAARRTVEEKFSAATACRTYATVYEELSRR